MVQRKATVQRRTTETSVKVEINIDGKSQFEVSTGIRFFDHMLCQLAQHGIFDLKVSANGTDQHHVVEDVAIALGRAFSQSLGEKQGIIRMGHAIVPMDDALAMVALDISGPVSASAISRRLPAWDVGHRSSSSWRARGGKPKRAAKSEG